MFGKNKTILSLMLAVLLSASATVNAAGEAVKADIDPRADALMKKMSDYLGALKFFGVDIEIIDEMVLADGFKLSLYRQGDVKIQRPDKFAMTRRGIAVDMDVVFNGRELVFYGRNLNAFLTLPVSGDIDAALDAGAAALNSELPARDLLAKDSYTPLMQPLEKMVYIGKVRMGGVFCHQLAARSAEVDWQIWIQDAEIALPCRYSITSKWLANAPQFSLQFSNWRINPEFPAGSFVFTPPKGAVAMDAKAFKAALAAQ